jgi:ribonuclease G
VIVRTVGEDVSQETIGRELQGLMNTWKRVQRKVRFMRAPALIHEETTLTRGLVRDLFSDKVDQLVVDGKAEFQEILEYLKGIAPELADRVQLHEEATPAVRQVGDRAGDPRPVQAALRPAVGRLPIFEPTEALVSIDVNSGRFVGKKDPEKTSLKTNVEAAREIARQLRLRDVGGIIVCDFIDMETQANRDRVLQELRQTLAATAPAPRRTP